MIKQICLSFVIFLCINLIKCDQKSDNFNRCCDYNDIDCNVECSVSENFKFHQYFKRK